MCVQSLQISNIKGFENSGPIHFDQKLNLLIGPNNAGKSIIIKAVYGLQRNYIKPSDIRIGSVEGGYDIEIEDLDTDYLLSTARTNFLPNGSFSPIFHCSMNKDNNNINYFVQSPAKDTRGSIGQILTSE